MLPATVLRALQALGQLRSQQRGYAIFVKKSVVRKQKFREVSGARNQYKRQHNADRHYGKPTTEEVLRARMKPEPPPNCFSLRDFPYKPENEPTIQFEHWDIKKYGSDEQWKAKFRPPVLYEEAMRNWVSNYRGWPAYYKGEPPLLRELPQEVVQAEVAMAEDRRLRRLGPSLNRLTLFRRDLTFEKLHIL
eukprot:RCo040259